MKIKKNQTGSILILTMVFTSIFIIIMGGLVSLTLGQQRLLDRKIASEKALQIAEAGANYYRWHLAHSINDYADGTGQTCNPCGPYQHTYADPWGGNIGKYEITVYPPPTGSDIVKIQAKGWLDAFPTIKRKVEVQFRRPSLVRYMVVANDNMRFGTDTNVYGEIHSNGGIRFDGVAHNIVASAQTTYTDPDEAGLCTIDPNDHNKCPGVWTSQPNPNNVFLAGTDYPVPVVDFNAITTDLSSLKTKALQNGTEIGNSGLWVGNGLYLEPSGKQGYLLQLKVVNNVTLVDITVAKTISSSCSGEGTYKILSTTAVATNVAMPSNGIIFVEDNAWVQGQLYNTGLTIVAGKFPETPDTNKDIYINNDITYYGTYETSKLNTTLGLIAQKNISIGLESEDNLEIHAAMLAQKGRIGRNYYESSCDATYYQRDTITIRGTMATYNRYGFSWTCDGAYCSGYHYRNLIFNDRLRTVPPPSYPVAGEYTFLGWKEISPN